LRGFKGSRGSKGSGSLKALIAYHLNGGLHEKRFFHHNFSIIKSFL
jgi:hypothetical protein